MAHDRLILQSLGKAIMNSTILTSLRQTSNEPSQLEEKINTLINISGLLVELIKLRAVSIRVYAESRYRSKYKITQEAKEAKVEVSQEILDQTKTEVSQEVLDEPLLRLAFSLEKTPLKEYQEELPDLLHHEAEALSENEICGKEKRIREIVSAVDLMHKKLNSLFNHSLLPISIRGEVVQTLMPKIGHPELIQEAESNYRIIKKLLTSIQALLDEDGQEGIKSQKDSDGVDSINIDKLLSLDVLDPKAQSVIGAMTAIELRRLRMEELFLQDQKKRKRKIRWAGLYIFVVTIVIVFMLSLVAIAPSNGFPALSLTTQNHVPLLNVPVLVVIWSLIGSFAAMIHRFNRNSVYYFNDLVKWMLTRHVQGVVLSSAFYLVLVSGLFLISGIPESPNPIRPEIIWVFSFLIGFSDRFVDSVFDTLIEKYSSNKKTPSKRTVQRVIR
jgi:hypothetical protein